VARLAVLLALAFAAYAGWREFWFLADDSFITFRYISNRLLGYGYTWNPPPFRPVEGYSNFLWLLLLEGVWRLFDAPPPDAANWLSLGFSYGTLSLGFLWIWRMALPARLADYRFMFAALVLAATLSNRTFLAWMSSGLETALFIFCVTLWAVAALELERSGRTAALWVVCAAAALGALTRPDGILMAVGSGLLTWVYAARSAQRGRFAAAALPLSVVVAHFFWRRAYYGEWLPNTYHAKHAGPWPESGARYAFCFALEYGLWAWLFVSAVATFVSVRRAGWRQAFEAARCRPASIVLVAVLVTHFAYYTFVIGGDHFEYRVYAHLVLPIWVSFVGFLGWLRYGPVAGAALLTAFWLVSLPLPWIHFARTRGKTDRESTRMLIQPVADALPRIIRPYGELFDVQQAWLIRHFVGLRHQEHKIFYFYTHTLVPPREDGQRLRFADGRPVLVYGVLGRAGWSLPDVAILDPFGLVDAVVARTPLDEDHRRHRYMAHDRHPPDGYFECFRPNVQILEPAQILVRPRSEPLTGDRIRECEARFRSGNATKSMDE
jgi:arabinofuranosyltransferase